MSSPRVIYLIISTSLVAHHIVYTAAISDGVIKEKGSYSNTIKTDHDHDANEESIDHSYRPVHHVFHYLTLILLIPLTVLVNVLVLLTVGLIDRLHTPHDVMVAAASLMDLLVGVVFLPVDVIELFDETFLGRTLWHCQLMRMTAVTFSISLTAYVLMSLERMIGVKFPFWYHRNVTCWNIVAVVTIVICTEVVLEFIIINMIIRFDEKLPVFQRCCLCKIFPPWYNKLFHPIIISTKLLISLVVCILVNFIARKHRAFIKCRTKSVYLTPDSVPFTERQSIIPIVCTFLFIILWVPKLIFDSLLLSPYHPMSATVKSYSIVVKSLLVCNSFINPILICSMKPMYRHSIRTILSTNPLKLGDLRNRLRLATNERFFKSIASTPATRNLPSNYKISSSPSEHELDTRQASTLNNPQRKRVRWFGLSVTDGPVNGETCV